LKELHNDIVACGYGVIEREYVGLFDIVVEEGIGFSEVINRQYNDESSPAWGSAENISAHLFKIIRVVHKINAGGIVVFFGRTSFAQIAELGGAENIRV
jgi:voltage-gated potassium channel Kch